MPRIFESLLPRTGSITPNPTASSNVSARDLTEIASRAQQRQQELITANPGERSLFPVQAVEGTLPSLLSSNSNEGSNTAPANAPRPQGGAGGAAGASKEVGQGSQVQTGTSVQPATRLSQAAFEDLSPSQRQDAYRTVFASDIDAVVGDDGTFQTTEAGSPLVAFRPRGADAYIQVAQEAVPANSLFAEALRRVGVSASPSGSGDHSVTYSGSDAEVVALARKFGAGVSRNSEGISVEFAPSHPLNTRFHEAPFAEREARQGPDPRLRRFLQ